MKKIIYTFLTIALLASCADFLDIRTEATMPTSGTDYSKSELIFQSVSAAYATLRLSEGDAFAYVSVLEMPCEDADKGSTPSDAAATAGEMDNFSYGATNTLVNQMWAKFYDIASAANHAIKEMAEFEKSMTTAENKTYCRQCAGEAKVIRAYAYFNLVRMFGSVPIVDRMMTAEELASNPAKSEAEVYQFIYNDLQEAIAVLPESYPKKETGRFTVYTARALKSKVALYRKDWATAASEADMIIRSHRFSLVPVFRDVFSMEYENSSESLMEIQASETRLCAIMPSYRGHATISPPICKDGDSRCPARRLWTGSRPAATWRDWMPPSFAAEAPRRRATKYSLPAPTLITTARFIHLLLTTCGPTTATDLTTICALSAMQRFC